MELFVQQLVNGIALGSLYAIFAMAFGLMFANLGLLNVAFGSLAIMGALVGHWTMAEWGLSWPYALIVGALAAAVLTLGVDRVAFQPLRARGRMTLAPIISSIALWMMLDATFLHLTDARPQSFPLAGLPYWSLEVGPVVIPSTQVLTIVGAASILIVLYLFLQRSRFGMAMRASGWNERSAVIVGVRPQTVIVVTTLIAGAAAGVAGTLGAMSANSITLGLGQALFLKGFAAVIVGGYGDIRGAALGGILLGVAEVMTSQYISNSFRDVVAMSLLILVLVFRPQGILGTREAPVRA